MSFRSLLFREFRLAKKIIFIQAALLLSFMAMVWGMVLSQDDVAEMLDTVTLMITLEAMLPVFTDDNFRADINSGWLSYSYSLPIDPLTRVSVRFIQRFSVTFVSILLSLVNSAALCAFVGKPFGFNQIVWHIVFLVMMSLYFLPNQLIILRSRSAAEMKKLQTVAGLTMFGLIVVVIVGIFIANGVTFEKLADEEWSIDLPVFTVSSLLWALPLLIILLAVSFFAEYTSLRSAYPNTKRPQSAKPEKKPAEIIADKPEAAPAKKTDGAVGLLYKELKQNRLVFFLTALTPLIMTLFPFAVWSVDALANHKSVNEWFEMSTNIIIRVVMLVGGFFCVSGLMSEVFSGDDKKLWAYFVVSTPQGVKGFIYRKYVIMFMVILTFIISGILAEHLLATVNYFVTGNELTTGLATVYIVIVFLLMFTSALDIPFTVRYGSKKGSIVKTIVMILLLTAVVAVYSLIPEEISSKITEAVISFFNGEANTSLLLIIVCLLPYMAMAAFVFSYRISCKLFLKGANEYDK